MGICAEFRKFFNRGDVIDLAISFIMAMAFKEIVTSMTTDLILPLVAALSSVMGLSDSSFIDLFVILETGANKTEYTTLEEAQTDGAVTFNYGNFIQILINFITLSVGVFMVFQLYERLRKKEAETEARVCPECCEEIKKEAKRCKHCSAICLPEPENLVEADEKYHKI